MFIYSHFWEFDRDDLIDVEPVACCRAGFGSGLVSVATPSGISALSGGPRVDSSKQARGYEAFTRRSCPTFPLCASAAGPGCIIHEHSVNLSIQNTSSLSLRLIYCPSFFHSVRPHLGFSLFVFSSPFSLLLFFPPIYISSLHQQTE